MRHVSGALPTWEIRYRSGTGLGDWSQIAELWWNKSLLFSHWVLRTPSLHWYRWIPTDSNLKTNSGVSCLLVVFNTVQYFRFANQWKPLLAFFFLLMKKMVESAVSKICINVLLSNEDDEWSPLDGFCLVFSPIDVSAIQSDITKPFRDCLLWVVTLHPEIAPLADISRQKVPVFFLKALMSL